MAETAQVTSTGTVQHAGEHAGFPPFMLETFPLQIFWFAVIFGLLYWAMSKFALPRVTATLDNRQQTITGDLDRAANAKADADAAGKAYEKTLADAKARAQATAQEAHQRLAAEAEARRKTLEGELSAKLAIASSDIAATRTRAMASVESIAQEAAAAIVKQLTGMVPDSAALAAAVAAAKGA